MIRLRCRPSFATLVLRGGEQAISAIAARVKKGVPAHLRGKILWILGSYRQADAHDALQAALLSARSRKETFAALQRQPNFAAELFAAQMLQPNPPLEIVRGLAHLAQQGSVPRLLTLAQSPSADVSAAAWTALAKVQAALALSKRVCSAALDGLSRRQPKTVIAALSALPRWCPPSAEVRVHRLLRHPQAAVRRKALETALQLRPHAAAPELASVLSDPTEPNREGAARWITEHPHPALVAQLITLLGEPAHRRQAAAALASLEVGFDALLRVAGTQPSRAVEARSVFIALALATHRRPPFLDAPRRRILIKRLRRFAAQKDIGARQHAERLYLIALVGDRSVAAGLQPLLLDPDAYVRALAALAVHVLGPHKAGEALLQHAFAHERHPVVIRRLADAAYALNVEVDPAFLVRGMRDPTAAPELLLLTSSARSRSPELARLRRQAARDVDPRMRAAALLAIAAAKESESWPTLVERLDDNDAQVRLAAAHALALLPLDDHQRARVMQEVEAHWRWEMQPRVSRALRRALRLVRGDKGKASPVATMPRSTLHISLDAKRPWAKRGRPAIDLRSSDGRWRRFELFEDGDFFLGSLPRGDSLDASFHLPSRAW